MTVDGKRANLSVGRTLLPADHAALPSLPSPWLTQPLAGWLTVVVLAAAGVWGVAGGWRGPEPGVHWGAVALIFALGIGAYQFPVELGRHQAAHVGSSLLLAGAFLFDPATACALAFATALAGNALLRLPLGQRVVSPRHPLSWLFNAAQAALAAGSASLVYRAFASHPLGFEPTTALAALGALLAACTAYLVGSSVVTVALAILAETPPGPLWLEGRRQDWREECGLALLAVVTALVADEYPWALVLQAGALWVVYLSFKQSAQVRSQTRMTIEHLAELVDRRDPYTYQHSRNVSRYATLLAARAGLGAAHVELIRSAALVHDIGKIAVPDAVLLKPARLDDQEWVTMKHHPVAGAEMVAALPEYRAGARLILHHHEAWDGSGYPDGLAGEAIPIGARIIAIADSYDAMTTARPYRGPLADDAMFEQFRGGRGRTWDPRLVDLWLELLTPSTGSAIRVGEAARPGRIAISDGGSAG